ncbi:hypothetical protein [Halomonas sp. 11-S5]|uniref:hypothetical protein n=1 Tax=Halomonas sp. 11-S5 TaxID=2994064 RepID=UPI00246891F7|nr:hypothetical protein [Halomonas sp. 11-S5]
MRPAGKARIKHHDGTPLYQYPAKTLLGRVVAKQRILAHVRATAKLRERLRNSKQFNRKVEINAELRSIRQRLADYAIADYDT